MIFATPSDVHARAGDRAALEKKRGRHVFVEKPIADTIDAAARRSARRARGAAGAADGRLRPSSRSASPCAAPPRWCARGGSARSCSPRRRSGCPGTSAHRRGARRRSRAQPGRSADAVRESTMRTRSARHWLGPVRRDDRAPRARAPAGADIDYVGGRRTMRFHLGCARRADRLVRVAAHVRDPPAGHRGRRRPPRRPRRRVARRRAGRRGLDRHRRRRAGRLRAPRHARR